MALNLRLSSILFIFLPSIFHTSKQTACKDYLLDVIIHLKQEIHQIFTECSSIDILFHSKLLEHLTRYSSVPSVFQTDLEIPGGFIIMDVYDAKNDTQLSFPAKYHRPCSMVVTDTSNEVNAGTEDPQTLLQVMPNNIHRSFFVLYALQRNLSDDILGQISAFTSLLQHTLLLACADDTESVVIFKGSALSNMSEIGYYRKSSGFVVTKPLFFHLEEDLEGRTVYALTCVVCNPDKELYERLGFWDNFVYGFMHAMCVKFNTTLDSEQVFGVPGDGLKEDGSWDDFVGPLVDGSAMLSTMIKPNLVVATVAYFTMPYLYDGAAFVTGPPMMKTNTDISVLKAPLNVNVWIVFILSLVSVFACLELVAYLHEEQRPHRKILIAVLTPIVDQNAFTSKFGRSTHDGIVNIMMGLWLLCLIVVSCAYRSELLSAIVIPKYIMPPQTFAELVESDYEIGGIFYSNFMENELRAANNTVSRKIMENVYEYDYIDPPCYQGIFEGKKACLGYNVAFDGIGIEFMVDIHGRKMFRKSKDTHYESYMVIGVSKFYPVFVESLNKIMDLLESTGVSDYSRRYGFAQMAKKGQLYAVRNVESKSYYRGVSKLNDAAEDRRTAVLLFYIARAGNLAAFIAFILECLHKRLWSTKRRLLADIQGSGDIIRVMSTSMYNMLYSSRVEKVSSDPSLPFLY